MPTHSHDAPHANHHDPDRSALLGTLLDLDAQIHHRMLDDALDAVSTHISAADVHRVLDVGAGTGTATFRLSQRYPQAHIIALDANARRIGQIAERSAQDPDAHITALHRTLSDTGLPPRSIDFSWAASVFHEFDDPRASLAVLSELIRPGGLLAIMEMNSSPRVLPDEYSELERRLRERGHADSTQSEWSPAIREAGFELLEKHTLSNDQSLPADGPGGAYARAELQRLAAHAGPALAAADRSELDHLLSAPTGLAAPAVRIRGSRSLWIARRP